MEKLRRRGRFQFPQRLPHHFAHPAAGEVAERSKTRDVELQYEIHNLQISRFQKVKCQFVWNYIDYISLKLPIII